MLKAKGRPFKSLLANFSELKNASHPNVTIATKEVEEKTCEIKIYSDEN